MGKVAPADVPHTISSQSTGSKLRQLFSKKPSNLNNNHLVMNNDKKGSYFYIDIQGDSTKLRTVIFMTCMGLLAISLGIGLTWLGADQSLNDFLVLGPSCLLLGVILLLAAALYTFMGGCKRNKADDNEQQNESPETVEMPNFLPDPTARTSFTAINRHPSSIELYGFDSTSTGTRRGLLMTSSRGSLSSGEDVATRSASMETIKQVSSDLPALQVAQPIAVDNETVQSADDTVFVEPIQIAPAADTDSIDTSQNGDASFYL